MKPTEYRFSFGPWNISDGADGAGPAVRPAFTFDWKFDKIRKLGFQAMMLHDDDVVLDIDAKSARQVRREAREMNRRFTDAGVAIDLVAPRLWSDPRTIDGAFTSNDKKARRYAIDRSLRAIEIANIVGCGLVDLCLVREGTYLREAKDFVSSAGGNPIAKT